MKAALGLVALAFSFSSHATPAVGDVAIYDVINGSEKAVMKLEILSFNASSSLYEMRTTTTSGGTAQTQTEYVKASDLYSDAKIAQILSACKNLEKITVPAGTFSTCKMIPAKNDTETVWVGAIPLGVVKGEWEIGGEQGRMVLTSYHSGN